MPQLQLIRHGEAYHQIYGSGFYDPEMTDRGREQCIDCRYEPGQIVFCSKLFRAIETALLLFPDRKIYVSDLFNEYNTGAACNSVLPDRDLSVPLTPSQLSRLDFESYRVDPLPIETTWEDGVRRAERVLCLVRGLQRSKMTIVSHGNFIRTLDHCLGHQGSEELLSAGSVVREL